MRPTGGRRCGGVCQGGLGRLRAREEEGKLVEAVAGGQLPEAPGNCLAIPNENKLFEHVVRHMAGGGLEALGRDLGAQRGHQLVAHPQTGAHLGGRVHQAEGEEGTDGIQGGAVGHQIHAVGQAHAAARRRGALADEADHPVQVEVGDAVQQHPVGQLAGHAQHVGAARPDPDGDGLGGQVQAGAGEPEGAALVGDGLVPPQGPADGDGLAARVHGRCRATSMAVRVSIPPAPRPRKARPPA